MQFTFKKLKIMLSTLALLSSGTTALAVHAATDAVPAAAYQLGGSVKLGSPDKFDFVYYDPIQQRVYATHGAVVTVVDARANSVLGNVQVGGQTHGVVTLPKLGLGVTDNDDPSEAVIFDLKSFKVIKRLPLAADSDAMAFDPASTHVFVIGGDSGMATAIDPKRKRVVKAIHLGGKAESAVADGAGKLYVNLVEKRQIVRVNTRTNQIDARWNIASCEAPHGLAIDAVTHRLFASCHNNQMLVVNAVDGKVLATLPIGAGTDAAAFDAQRKLAFSSNKDGTLSVIAELGPNEFVALPEFKTALGAKTMAVDAVSGRVFLVTADVDSAATAKEKAGHLDFVPDTVKMLFVDPVK